jgi:hypothetical protein
MLYYVIIVITYHNGRVSTDYGPCNDDTDDRNMQILRTTSCPTQSRTMELGAVKAQLDDATGQIEVGGRRQGSRHVLAFHDRRATALGPRELDRGPGAQQVTPLMLT